MPKRVLEGGTQQDRAKTRRQLGTLRQLTVQPATRKRYDKAVDHFLGFLRKEGIALPTDKKRLDPLVCDYLEHLWATGQGRGLACDTLAHLQDLQPGLRTHMPAAWRLLKTWQTNEIPNRAPPLPEHLVHAMAGWAIFNGWISFAVSLLLGFYTMLRTGEILGVVSSHVELGTGTGQALVNLGFTKGGKRHGAAESVVLGYEPVVKVLKAWKQAGSPSTRLTPSPPKWRALFNSCLEGLQIQDMGFRPYSLRRGGATFWFQKHQNLDRILVQGRWHTQKSARIYLNEGLAVLSQLKLPTSDARIRPFLTVCSSFFRQPRITSLEPPAKGGRAGGLGRHPKRSRKGKGKSAFRFVPFFRHPRSVLDAYSVSEVWLGLSRSSRADPTTQGVAGWLGPTFHW